MTIRRREYAICMLDKNGKNRNTHSEYVILAFPLQTTVTRTSPNVYVISTLPVFLSHTIFRLPKLILLENCVSANIFPATKFSYNFPLY